MYCTEAHLVVLKVRMYCTEAHLVVLKVRMYCTRGASSRVKGENVLY